MLLFNVDKIKILKVLDFVPWSLKVLNLLARLILEPKFSSMKVLEKTLEISLLQKVLVFPSCQGVCIVDIKKTAHDNV